MKNESDKIARSTKIIEKDVQERRKLIHDIKLEIKEMEDEMNNTVEKLRLVKQQIESE